MSLSRKKLQAAYRCTVEAVRCLPSYAVGQARSRTIRWHGVPLTAWSREDLMVLVALLWADRRAAARRDEPRIDKTQEKRCRWCGRAGLYWEVVGPAQWRLVDAAGLVHECDEYYRRHGLEAPPLCASCGRRAWRCCGC